VAQHLSSLYMPLLRAELDRASVPHAFFGKADDAMRWIAVNDPSGRLATPANQPAIPAAF